MPNATLDFRPDPGTIPDQPGCYQFKDRHGRVVYVGKAKSLRSRVSSYFTGWRTLPQRTRSMLEAARSVEWIVVDTEVEALHLEYTLIQRHKPRYNIRYTDDKSYPYLVLTTSQEVPRAGVRRGRIPKDDRRFGPYAHAYAIRETLDLLLRVFPVRTCRQGTFDRAARLGRPCLLFHIDRCAAPCTGEVSVEEHRVLVDDLAAFLEGRTVEMVLDRLETEMRTAADHQLYEAAARLRDQLFAARRALEKQQVVSQRAEDFDVVAVHEDELEAAVQAFFVRHGRLVGRKGWTVDKVQQLSGPELLQQFLVTLYEEREDDVPPLVVVPQEPADRQDLELLLGDIRRAADDPGRGAPRTRRRVEIRVPQRGDKRDVLETVADNARESFQRNRLKRGSDFNARSRAMEELQEALGLDDAPLRIECVDISHLGGTEVVASMVVFEDALPKRSDYRRFKLSDDRNDDYAAMREVFRRRFTRLLDERSAPVVDDDGEARRFAYPPNLVIVDGGPGQLNAALAGVADVGGAHGRADDVGPDRYPVGEDVLPAAAPTGGLLDEVAFCGLAKRFEELWLPGRSRPVVLPRGSEALYLVQRVRDEAHRFAITYQRRRRTDSVSRSELDDVPGIGPARRSALLERFGSAVAIRRSSVQDLQTVPGISRTLAVQVLEHLGVEVDPAGDGGADTAG